MLFRQILIFTQNYSQIIISLALDMIVKVLPGKVRLAKMMVQRDTPRPSESHAVTEAINNWVMLISGSE